MHKYIPLSDEEVTELAQDAYRHSVASNNATSQENPRAVLVAGQPGAGKSSAISLSMKEVEGKGGCVYIDLDRYRQDIRDNQFPADTTHNDASRIKELVRQYAIENRMNIIEEGTYKSPKDTQEFVGVLKNNNYKVEFLALAVAKEESTLSVYERYERDFQRQDTNPRFVPESVQTSAYDGLAKTLAQVEVDRVRVMARGGNVLYDSMEQGNSRLASDALKQGRVLGKNGEDIDKNLIQFARRWEGIKETAQARGAPQIYMDEVNRHMEDTLARQKDRIHDHAMGKLDENLAVLVKDPRFAQYSDAQLTKAAYWRGFSEKACEFKGKPANPEGFDATMSKRAALDAVPNVLGLEPRKVERDIQQLSKPSRDDDLSL